MGLAHWCCRLDEVEGIYNIYDDDCVFFQKRDTNSLSASSLQTWQVAPLCNGKVKVINVGTGNTMSFGPWLYDSETKLLKSDTGRWAMNKKRKGLRLEAKVKYLKNTTTPWKRFQWNIVKV